MTRRARLRAIHEESMSERQSALLTSHARSGG
jgi:hypothetical protein